MSILLHLSVSEFYTLGLVFGDQVLHLVLLWLSGMDPEGVSVLKLCVFLVQLLGCSLLNIVCKMWALN